MDYNKLHTTSTIDIVPLLSNKPSKRKRNDVNIYEVERLVAKRSVPLQKQSAKKKKKPVHKTVQYLVKWKGFSAFQSSWEDADDISDDCIHYFEQPNPNEERVISACDNIRNAVEMFLKSRSELPISISFPGDVFKFLFSGKGEVKRGWLHLPSSAFPSKYFTRGWDTYYDNLGQGVKVEYPILLKYSLSFSSQKYLEGNDHSPVLAPKSCREVLKVKFNKVAGGFI